MTLRHTMRWVKVRCWQCTTVLSIGRQTWVTDIHHYTQTTRRCSISWASTSFLAANVNTWITFSRWTVRSSTSQEQPMWCRCFEQNLPSHFGNAIRRHHYQYLRYPDHQCRGIEPRGVYVTGERCIFWSNCKHHLPRSRLSRLLEIG